MKTELTLIALLFLASFNGFAQTKFNRNIPNDAHMAISNNISKGISTFSFTPSGGWMMVTKTGKLVQKNIPVECEKKVKEYLAKGHKIEHVAFPPKGGNSWVIVTDKTTFSRNIPDECYKKIQEFQKRGKKIKLVTFPIKAETVNSWVVLNTDGTFYARNIDDECYQILRNLRQSDMPGKKAARKITHISFAPNGGFVVLAEDYHFARNINDECFTRMNLFSKARNLIHTVAFNPKGKGWSVISNRKVLSKPKDKIRNFENNVAGKSIWRIMRELKVPGVSIGVVINGKLAWTTAYGHLKKGDRKYAVHPESMFQAASISKVLAAMGAYKLTEQRKIGLTQNLLTANQLKWNEPFDSRIKNKAWTKNFKHVTIFNILNHKSGIEGRAALLEKGGSNYMGRNSLGRFEGGGYGGYTTSQQIPNLTKLMEAVKITYDPTEKPNNQKSWYSGKAFTLLQKLTTDVSKQNYPLWMKQNILEPMGMRRSSFTTGPENIYAKDQLTWGHAGTRITPVRNRYPKFAAAGLYTNAEELANVLITINNDGVFNNKRVISFNNVKLLSNGNGTNISDGNITSSNTFYAHGGSNEGYRTYLIGFKNIKGEHSVQNAGIVVLTNSEILDFRYDLANAVINPYGW